MGGNDVKTPLMIHVNTDEKVMDASGNKTDRSTRHKRLLIPDVY
jgi:hypothetical protein